MTTANAYIENLRGLPLDTLRAELPIAVEKLKAANVLCDFDLIAYYAHVVVHLLMFNIVDEVSDVPKATKRRLIEPYDLAGGLVAN